MTIPIVMRVNADGSGQAERIINGRIRKGSLEWFVWLRQPAISPDGKTVAIVSRRARPDQADVGAPALDLARSKLTDPNVSEIAPLGHQDPGVDARRQDAAVRHERPRRRPRDAGDLPLQPRRARTAAADRPGYLEPSLVAGRHATSPRPGRRTFGTDIVILDASTGREVLRRHDRRPVLGAGVVAEGRRDRVPPHRAARSSTCGSCRSAGTAPDWTADRHDRPDRGRPASTARRGPAGSSPRASCRPRRPRRPPVAAAERVRQLDRARPVTGTYLERLAARSRADRRRSSASASTPTRRPCPPGSRATSRASSGSRRCVARGGGAVRRRGQAQPRVLRGVRVAPGSRRSSGSAAASRPTCRSSPTPSAATSARRRPARRVALFDALGADAVTVSPYLGADGHRAAPRAPRPLRVRPVPHLEPGRRRAPGPRSSPRIPTPGARPSRSTTGSPGAPRTGAPGGHRRPRGRRDGAGRAARRSGRSRPGLPFLVPGVGAQGGDDGGGRSPRGPATARAGRRPPGGGLLVNVSRGIAGAGDAPVTSVRADPGEAIAAAAAEWARRAPCATVDRAPDGRALVERPAHLDTTVTGADRCPTSGPVELIIILVIALLILGPGKLPEVGASLGKSIREFRKASTDIQDARRASTPTPPRRAAAASRRGRGAAGTPRRRRRRADAPPAGPPTGDADRPDATDATRRPELLTAAPTSCATPTPRLTRCARSTPPPEPRRRAAPDEQGDDASSTTSPSCATGSSSVDRRGRDRRRHRLPASRRADHRRS